VAPTGTVRVTLAACRRPRAGRSCVIRGASRRSSGSSSSCST
jgi:hypothetical protein